MGLMKRLRNLDRRVLVGLSVALLAIGAGLVYAGWRTLRQPQMAMITPQDQIQPAIAASATPIGAGAHPTIEVVETPVVELVVRTAGPLLAAGDIAGAAMLFDVEEAMTFVEALTAPQWAGRQGGSPGGAAAAAYIADRFEESGLQPAGTEGYFQPFFLPYAEILDATTFVITTTAGTIYDDFNYSEDYRFAWGGYAGGGEADGQVFWVNEGQPQDYDDMDVSGGIVLCNFSLGDEVARQAMEHGANGLIMLARDERRITSLRTYREPAYLPESLPTLLVSEEVAEALLDGSGYSVQDLSILYESVPLSTASHFEVFLEEQGEALGCNVLGVLPGADPELSGEVLVIGGHYDHLGTDANGDIYYGANDNASGVATILEVARNWQEAGFTPDRTVLFAAWDGEEQGLLGSIHYVEHPRYPLTTTVGMVQLDMVGLASEGILTIDGYDTSVGRQLQASARMIDVPTRKSAIQGGSDHAPFQSVRIPAVLLIWDDADVPYYHTPDDTSDTLQPERLRDVGVMTSHTAMVLSSVAPRLEELLIAQAEAIIAGDVEAYVATLDPEDVSLVEVGREWLTSRPVEAREAYTISVGAIEMLADTALVDVRASTVGVDGRETVMASTPVHLIRRGTAWHTTWPVADVVTTTHIVARFLRHSEDNSVWARSMDEAYGRFAPVLGLAEAEAINITVYPNDGTLEWMAGAGESESHSPIPGVHVARTGTLTRTAIGLILDQMGLPQGEGDWLRVGLGEWVNTRDDPEAQRQQTMDLVFALGPALLAQDVMTGTLSTLGSAGITMAESMAGYFMERQGGDGLRRLCQAWGEIGTQGGAFIALGASLRGFADTWEAAVAHPLVAVQEEIQATLEQREMAVLSSDKDAFLETVTSDDPVFLAEEAQWFDYLSEHSMQEYKLGGQLLDVGEDSALVRLTTSAKLADIPGVIPSGYIACFRWVDDRWVLAGPDWKTLEGERVTIRYMDASPEVVSALLEVADQAYVQVNADLRLETASHIEIKLYSDDDVFRASTLPPVPSSMLAWYQPGGAIKLSPRVPASEFVGILARGLTHSVLHELGVELGWVREGLSTFESVRAFPEQASSLKSRYVPLVREALRRQNLYDWENMPETFEMDEKELSLLRGQSWMLVDELVREFGMDALNRLVRGLVDGQSFQDAFAVATGKSFSDWEPIWEETVRSGGVPKEWVEVAQSFDPERVLEIVRHLASPAYAGRRAGSEEAEAVALWIADQMAAFGLEPGVPDGTFYQAVPLPYSELTAMPTLTIHNSETVEALPLSYRETFRESVGGYAGGGQVDAELVWLPGGYGEEMHLGGRVAIKKRQADPVEEAKTAYEHGAGGLILISRYPKMRERLMDTPASGSETLPVVEMDETSWSQILRLAGITAIEANSAPPALVMPLRCQLSVPYEPARAAMALNVIGMLPGTQPEARPLVVAANYDGAGALPDGTLYPGANKNAAGVAVMLEMARLWQMSGYVPERPIYFIAWGAEEPGLASSRYYSRYPVVPPERILGLLELDTVGASREYYLDLDWETRSTVDPLFARQSVEGRREYYVVEQRVRERDLLFNLELAGELLDRRLSRGKAEVQKAHEIFRGRGVPSVLIFWPRAVGVHTLDDTPDTLDAYKLATTGEVVMLTTMMVAQ